MELLDWEDDTSHASIDSNIITAKRIRKPPRRLSFYLRRRKGLAREKLATLLS